MKSVAGLFGVSDKGSRAGVVTFSKESKQDIKLNTYSDINSFDAAVDAIPLMGSITRIDKGLRQAQQDMFKSQNGARNGIAKVLFLFTDGSQTGFDGAEEPAVIASELRNSGIHVIVIGIGENVNSTELRKIAGGDANVFKASFADLYSEKLKISIRDKACACKLVVS